MPLFKPIRSIADLPPPGPTTRTAEGRAIDFKNTYGHDRHAEMAKDMAAFANALGGVILIGTSQDHEPLEYPGIPRDYVERVWSGFADAHARHLSPKPPGIEHVIFDAPPPALPGRVLLAVNVHPFAEQLVGARVGPGWRFPVRVGVDTIDLEPAMLPLYTPTVRRNMILLENIDRTNDKVKICFRNPRNQSTAEPAYLRVSIHEVNITKNVLVVSIEGESTVHHRIPLDDVERVWDEGASAGASWIVRVLGHFGGDRRGYHSNPSNTFMRT